MKRSHLLRFVCIGLISLGVSSFSARAQVTENIEWDALADFILNPDGSKAAVGDTLLLGLFPTSFNFSANQTFLSLSAAFTQLRSTTIVAPGQFSDNFNLTTAGSEGKQLYIWAFNNATPSAATAWAILTNTASNWQVPPNGGNTILDTQDIGTFVPLGARGFGVMPSMQPLSNNNTDWKMTLSVVPEPSSFVLLGVGALAFAGILWRRAKKA